MFFKKEKPPEKANEPEASDGAVYCSDCRWIVGVAHSSKCSHPAAKRQDGPQWSLVARGNADDLHYCANMRAKEWDCGPKAKMFEAKPKPPEVPPYRGVLDNIDCSLLRIAKQLETIAPMLAKKRK